eukprot:365966-Chlamydomonas_euryale.AAC.11
MTCLQLSTFLAAASASPAILAAATDPSTAVTVLAPTNNAFEVALAALGLDVSALVGNTELLTQVRACPTCECLPTLSVLAGSGGARLAF